MKTVFGQTLALWLGNGYEHRPLESDTTGLNVTGNLYLYSSVSPVRQGFGSSHATFFRPYGFHHICSSSRSIEDALSAGVVPVSIQSSIRQPCQMPTCDSRVIKSTDVVDFRATSSNWLTPQAPSTASTDHNRCQHDRLWRSQDPRPVVQLRETVIYQSSRNVGSNQGSLQFLSSSGRSFSPKV